MGIFRYDGFFNIWHGNVVIGVNNRFVIGKNRGYVLTSRVGSQRNLNSFKDFIRSREEKKSDNIIETTGQNEIVSRFFFRMSTSVE